MSSQERERRERPVLEPFSPAGVTILLAEIIAAISLRRENHGRGALRADDYVEALHRNRAVDNPAEDPEVIDQRAEGVVLGITGRDRLRIEIIRIHEIGVLRADMNGGGEDLFRRKNEIK